jgi:hypothetical protein
MHISPPRLWTDEQLGKAVAVILNQVQGLWWAYYDVDLAFEEPGAPGVTEILARIERTALGYRWTGTPAEERVLLPVLLHVLNDQPAAAREIFRRIFDVNEIPAESGADIGLAGRLNRADREHREREYLRAVRAGKCESRPVLVAEGDSWFQFPGFTLLRLGRLRIHVEFVREIIDHLIRSNRYCIRSIAAGGDWLSSMLRTKDYIEPLSRIEPDAFLFSGGGNDLLADGRVGNMVRHKRRLGEPGAFSERCDELVQIRCGATAVQRGAFDQEKYALGARFLSKDFVSFMNLTLVQCFLFFSSLTHSKLHSMAIVTQGYDYAVPMRKSTARWYSLRHWINRGLGSGKWLWMPLEQKRLDESEKRAVAYALITEFNELMIALAQCGRFPRLYHVDLRGVAHSDRDWYDEIHLTSKAFGRAAAVYEACLSDVLAAAPSGRKVFQVQ